MPALSYLCMHDGKNALRNNSQQHYYWIMKLIIKIIDLSLESTDCNYLWLFRMSKIEDTRSTARTKFYVNFLVIFIHFCGEFVAPISFIWQKSRRRIHATKKKSRRKWFFNRKKIWVGFTNAHRYYNVWEWLSNLQFTRKGFFSRVRLLLNIKKML